MNHRSHACVKQVLVAGFLFGQLNVLHAKQAGCCCLKEVDWANVINAKEHISQIMKNIMNLERHKRNIGLSIKLATNGSGLHEAQLQTTIQGCRVALVMRG